MKLLKPGCIFVGSDSDVTANVFYLHFGVNAGRKPGKFYASHSKRSSFCGNHRQIFWYEFIAFFFYMN